MGTPLNLSRAPKPALRPFVELLWASDAAPAPDGRELVLPTGAVHLVIRLADRPLRLFRAADDAVGETVASAVIGGARAGPYLRDASRPAASVGALLRPGAAGLLAGAPAGLFSHAHTPLDQVWSAAAVAEMRERLSEVPSPAARLDLFEALLAARLPRLRGIDPLVAHALARFDAGGRVGDVVRESGWSHRYVTGIFREQVGLAPKTWCRLRRFGRLLDRLGAEPDLGWAELAAAEGYADQAHLTREFRDFAGVSPGRYRRMAPAFPRHLPV